MTSRIGRFTSGAAKERFMAAYDAAMLELPEPDETRDIRTSFGVVRAYYFEGADPNAAPLVLLPGRSSGAPVWADNLPSLLEVRSVWLLDLLGEPGMSIQDRPIDDDEDQAQWLDETLAQLSTTAVHLVGVSIGGWTAMNLATRNSNRIASVSLLDPVFVFADLSFEAILRSIPISLPWAPRSWRDDFNSWTAGGAPVEDVPVADMIEAGMQGYTLKLPAPSRIPERALVDLKVPVLAILAGASPMQTGADAAEFARRYLPAGHVRVYPDASHAINGEYPREIAADIAAFLEEVESSTLPSSRPAGE